MAKIENVENSNLILERGDDMRGVHRSRWQIRLASICQQNKKMFSKFQHLVQFFNNYLNLKIGQNLRSSPAASSPLVIAPFQDQVRIFHIFDFGHFEFYFSPNF